jgi:hypothetical protein
MLKKVGVPLLGTDFVQEGRVWARGQLRPALSSPQNEAPKLRAKGPARPARPARPGPVRSGPGWPSRTAKLSAPGAVDVEIILCLGVRGVWRALSKKSKRGVSQDTRKQKENLSDYDVETQKVFVKKKKKHVIYVLCYFVFLFLKNKTEYTKTVLFILFVCF